MTIKQDMLYRLELSMLSDHTYCVTPAGTWSIKGISVMNDKGRVKRSSLARFQVRMSAQSKHSNMIEIDWDCKDNVSIYA